MEHQEIAREFKAVIDTPAHIREWMKPENEEVRGKASLDKDNEYHVASGRHNAEMALELHDKSVKEWSDEDYAFAGRVVNYAHRSAGIATHHPHDKDDHHGEVSGTGMTKNEIARRNWGLPAKPKE